MFFKIGVLAKRYGLSRSTLLYYDRIGLLRPTGRQRNSYRFYSKDDEDRLRQIVILRQTGAPVRVIRRMLESGVNGFDKALMERLEQLNSEIAALREQQRWILEQLQSEAAISCVGVMNRQLWVNLLTVSGFSQDDMNRWHISFERSFPAQHQSFLEFLCLPRSEIRTIRQCSRNACVTVAAT